MTPVDPWGGGGERSGGNLTGYLDSPHMVSQYLLIHSKAVKALIKLDISQKYKIRNFMNPS